MSKTLARSQNNFKVVIPFLIIFFTGLGLRFFYFPFNVPLIADGMDYFIYATEIVAYGHLPTDWTPINNGWSIFVSFWLSIVNLENTFQYMQFHRMISVILSSFTVIPVYFLCRNFFNKKISLVGVSFFAFDPRILLNSFLGITEPLFILLGVSSLVLFLKYEQKAMLLSFALASFCTIVRSEGIFFFIILSILFFVKHKLSKEIIRTYLPCLIIFFLILMPIVTYRIDVTGYDGIFQRAAIGTTQIVSIANENKGIEIFDGVKLFLMYFGWILIPGFLAFLPFGIIQFFRHRNKETNFILIFSIIYSLPILYAYIVQAQDTRYFYFLFPIFCLISLFAVKTYFSKFSHKNFLLIIFIIGIFSSSVLFYEYQKFDFTTEKNYNIIGKLIIEKSTGINYHPTITRYVYANQLPSEWPFIESKINFETKIIPTEKFTNLETYIKHSKTKLSNLVVDQNPNIPEYLKDVYYNEENYPYLIKIYDSVDGSLEHRVKLFEIDYDKFNSINQ